MLNSFAHHTEAHTLGMREVIIFAMLIVSIIMIIKLAGASK